MLKKVQNNGKFYHLKMYYEKGVAEIIVMLHFFQNPFLQN